MQYDLCLPWYWEYDADFVHFVEDACSEHGVSFWQITLGNLLESTTALFTAEKTFKTLLYRGQGDPRFDPIPRWASEHGARRINPLELSKWSEDKATMHLEFINHGLHTPYSILLAPFQEQPVVPPIDLSPLGNNFVIKPSNGGGGEGVIVGASSVDDILRARLDFPGQKYLVQARVTPRLLDARPAWFRIFFSNGETYPCWWDIDTHIYATVSAEEESQYSLGKLREITRGIASICKLDWFSTEIALADEFIIVDYVNDEIDTRIQSQALDGVPDEVIRNMARDLVTIAKEIV